MPSSIEPLSETDVAVSCGTVTAAGRVAPVLAPSLPEAHRTIPVAGLSWFKKVLAFAGPGYLVAVGYMDPGNWATDIRRRNAKARRSFTKSKSSSLS